MPKRLPVAINDEEFKKLLHNTKYLKHKIAFLLGYRAGMRVSEVVKLEPRHIRFHEKNILIELGKGGKDRIVPLPREIKESHVKQLPLGMGARSLQISFKRNCKKAGLLDIKPNLHFHSLRHGFATNAVSAGIPIHHVRTLLGHSNISTTNVYLMANPKEALKSYEELF